MTIYEEAPKRASSSAEAAISAGRTVVAGLPSDNPSTSYWLQDPSPVLLGHRTTPELPDEVDVVVVGSGITGSFAADALFEEDNCSNKSVLLLEAREACSGATGRNGGHCQPLVYFSAPDVAAFELATFHFLERFVAENKVPCDWRTLPGGGVHGYLDADLFALAEELVETLGKTHPDLASQVTVVRPDSTDADGDHPSLESLRLRGAAGALVQRHAASVWPYKLVAWVLERLVKKHGASGAFNLQTNTPALSIAQDTSSDSPLWIVETTRGKVRARAVLLATNGYLSHLLPPSLADLVVPVRAQIAALVPPSSSTKVETSETVEPAPANVTSMSTSSSSSSSNGVSKSSITVVKTENGQTSTTTKNTTSNNVPADRLSHSYVFVGHDHERPSGGNRDEYLVQRPFTTGSSGATQTVHSTASSSGGNASAFATSSSFSTPSTSGGHLIWGGGRQRAADGAVGVWQDDEVESSVATYLRSHLAPILDVGGEEPPVPLEADYEWTGIMGFSRDQNPWVGRVPTSALLSESTNANSSSSAPSGLYVSAGYTGHGMPSTSLCGRAVAGIIKRDLGWENTTATEDDKSKVSVALPLRAGGHAEMPRSFLMTAERIQAARATCEPVAEASSRGFLTEFQHLLAARRAGN
ncbi:hypothetical protein SEUCBS139899_004668 [Sporothrix eucalyptigena]|uniref:FAD dependent oxidoreductase domain-containing protein n=1 Tax=Sporothrix eucalyptigena TaxID=1812306 RepID=A0ABP0C4X8_9PEZI